MKIRLLAFVLVGALTSAALLTPASSVAQETGWPNKPIRIIAAGVGSATDIRARWLAVQLASALGQGVVVENKPGAGGNIGMEYVARSTPDGYTLAIVHPGTLAINPHLYARTGYDALKDFIPISMIGGIAPLVLAVNRDSPANTLAELIRLARIKPNQMSFGSPGIGTPPHMASELLCRLAGVEATHVPYKSGALAANDLVAGHLAWTIDGAAVQMNLVQAGRLRALAVTTRERVASMPDVPTVAEAGVPGYELSAWVGIAAPAGTPQQIVSRLHTEITRILETPEAKAYFANLGMSTGVGTPEALMAQIRAEHAKWAVIVKQAGLKAE